MATTLLASAAQLSNPDLLARLKQLAAREREATAALVAHLAELDARRLYLAEGCASLFTYCTQVLHLSEHAAYGRIEAARAARRYPLLLEPLAEGSVTLTTVTLLAPHLTSENHRDLLARARHASKREVEALVARLRPQPPVPASVRKLPTPTSATTAQPTPPAEPMANPSPAGNGHGAPAVALPAPALTPPPARPAVVAPLAPERYRVQFTASAETYATLRLAQDLLRHQIPDGDLGQVLDRALTALVQELTRKKCAATARPRGGRGTAPGSRRGPARGLAARRRPVRLRESRRPPVHGAGGARVPPRAALRRGGRGHGGQHPAPVPGAQRVRGRARLRAPPPVGRAGAERHLRQTAPGRLRRVRPGQLGPDRVLDRAARRACVGARRPATRRGGWVNGGLMCFRTGAN